MNIIKKSNFLKIKNFNCNKKYLPFIFFLLPVFLLVSLWVREYVDLIIEADFLHVSFLRAYVEDGFNLKLFMTKFGEHLIPGYNLILLVNYKLFDIWVGAELILYGVSILSIAILIATKTYHDLVTPFVKSQLNRFIGTGLVFSILLSLSHQQQWGMSLAATFGVLLFVIFVKLCTSDEQSLAIQISGILFLALITFIFCGAYAAGALASAVYLFLVKRDCKRFAIFIFSSIFGAAYLYLISDSFVNVSNVKPDVNLIEVWKYASVMISNSIMGNALYENTSIANFYIIPGSALLIISFFVFLYEWRLKKTNYFFGMLYVYSMVNILAASFARHQYGIGNAFGSWYIVHSVFVVIYILISTFRKKEFILGRFLSVMILLMLIAGNIYSWKKSFYVADWKRSYVAQAESIIYNDRYRASVKDSAQSLLWDPVVVKESLDFFADKKLWIFKNFDTRISGVEFDGWMTTKPVTVFCPSGKNYVKIEFTVPESWPSIKLTIDNGVDVVTLDGPIYYQVPIIDKKSVTITGVTLNKPDIGIDERDLVAVVREVKCE